MLLLENLPSLAFFTRTSWKLGHECTCGDFKAFQVGFSCSGWTYSCQCFGLPVTLEYLQEPYTTTTLQNYSILSKYLATTRGFV